MSAFEEIKSKDYKERTELEDAIIYAWSTSYYQTAMKAAEQLAMLEENCANAIQANIEVEQLNVEFQERIDFMEKKIDELNAPMPCGHLARYVVNADEGTQYCALCVLDATQLTITNLVNDDDPDSETRLYELADKLTNHDNGQECPYCYKTEWGKEKHAADCPFAIAYDVLDKKDGRK